MHAATVDIADTDRLALAPGAVDLRARFVLAKLPVNYTWGVYGSTARVPRSSVAMLIGYAAPPDLFQSHLAELDQLVHGIQTSCEGEETRGIVPDASAVPAPPPPVEGAGDEPSSPLEPAAPSEGAEAEASPAP